MSQLNFIMRSLLFAPGHNEKLIRKAASTNADVLVLDLEDSVQPKSNKTIAKNLIIQLAEEKIFDQKVIIRVNDRESGLLLKEVYDLTISGVYGFMVPKIKNGEDIYFFDKLLETIEYDKGIEIGTFKIIALLETTAAIMNLNDICKASKRVFALAYGSEDFCADLEGIHDIEETSLFVPRAMIAMAARAHSIIPIDTVHIEIHDLEDLEKNLKIAKNLGFEAMMALHPKELPLIHKYYTPSEKEIESAKEILDLSDKAEIEGNGVVIRNGKFIGPPLVNAAKKIIKKYELIKQK